jgi:hypothetical protein
MTGWLAGCVFLLQVHCGWSHNIAKGICQDGSFVFAGWGRCDMGQLPAPPKLPSETAPPGHDATAEPSHIHIPYPVLLPALPSSEDPQQRQHQQTNFDPEAKSTPPYACTPIAEVWCGSEYSIASDASGLLWGCGWNEHGNLTDQTISASASSPAPHRPPSFVTTWTPVLHAPQTDVASSSSSSKGSDHDQGLAHEAANAALHLAQVQLVEVWEGAVSCGGAHCLAFATTTP